MRLRSTASVSSRASALRLVAFFLGTTLGACTDGNEGLPADGNGVDASSPPGPVTSDANTGIQTSAVVDAADESDPSSMLDGASTLSSSETDAALPSTSYPSNPTGAGGDPERDSSTASEGDDTTEALTDPATDATSTDATSTDTTDTTEEDTDTSNTTGQTTDAEHTTQHNSTQDTSSAGQSSLNDGGPPDGDSNDSEDDVVTRPEPVEAGTDEEPEPLPPQLVDGPQTIAAEGIALVTPVAFAAADVIAVHLGEEAIDPSDRTRVQWVAGASPTQPEAARLAVRAPATLSPGPTVLQVVTQRGNVAWPVEVIRPTGLYPNSPLGIAWISAAQSGVFPISTVAPGILIVDSEGGASADTDFQYRVWMSSAGREDCPIARAGEGILYGYEQVRVDEQDTADPEAPLYQEPVYVEHPIEGEFEVHPDANRVRLTIDRTPSGGVLEAYFGGWASYDGNSDPFNPELPPPEERAQPLPLDAETAVLVLTSELTGRQLIMTRRLNDVEESGPVRICLPDIP